MPASGCRSPDRYRHILRRPLLTRDEEKDLAILARRGHTDARRRLIESGVRIVFDLAAGFRRSGLALDDLIQEGLAALCVAADRFDPSHGLRFISFARPVVQRALFGFVAAQGGPVHLHEPRAQLRAKILRTQSAIEQAHQRPASTAEVAAAVGMKEREVISLLGARREVELDAPMDADIEDPAHHVGGVACPPTQHVELEDSALNQALRWCLRRLPALERRILRLRYGLDPRGPMRQEDVRRVLGISERQIYQTEKRAMVRLAGLGKRLRLGDYLGMNGATNGRPHRLVPMKVWAKDRA